MNKFRARTIAAIVTLSCFAGGVNGQNIRDAELKGRTLCIDKFSFDIDIDEPLTLNLEAFSSRVKAELIRRLTLSRVKYSEESGACHLSTVEVSVRATSGPTRGWFTNIRVSDWFTPAYPTYATFWEKQNFGFVNRSGSSLEDYLFGQARDLIETLALAWIKANP